MSAVTKNLSRYVKDKGINITKMARETGIQYQNLYISLCGSGRDRSLRDNEFLAVCKFLDVDPMRFAEPQEGEKQ